MLRWLPLPLVFLILMLLGEAGAQAQEEIVGTPWTGDVGVQETTDDIMARQSSAKGTSLSAARARPRFRADRTGLPENPDSLEVSSWSTSSGALNPKGATTTTALAPQRALAPQTPGLNFTAATLADTAGSFPPDTMGVVGPSQFMIVLNSRIRVFDKVTGGVGSLNADLDVFFASVRGSDFSGDPRVRYDRLSGRWIVSAFTDAAGSNKLLLAVSNNGTINGSTVWTYFSFQHDLVSPAGDTGNFADYPTLGVDANAVYMGIAVFTPAGAYTGTTAFVIRKSSILGAGPIVVSAFRNLTGSPGGAGPANPHGADNYDPAATEGYFIGADNASFGKLMLRRVGTPGGTPTLSANISITVPATLGPIPVPHLGNSDTTNGKLDPIDDRLMAAHVRNGRLWTSHGIGVSNTGVSTGTVTRNAARWYELSNLSATPAVVQSGTLFTATDTNVTTARHYWIPTVMVSGQGHAALGISTAGTNERANAATAGRLATDALGTLQAPLLYTTSTTAYNPPGNTGVGAGFRRWGDYSMTSLDPSDDMTMWTVQEFCNATNTYGVQVVRLKAPPPATPSACNPATLGLGATNANVIVTGTSTSGSGFFDPGSGFTNRLVASVSGTGVTVNSVTYTDPTHFTLNVTVAANAASGARTITVVNPDAQSAASASGILTIGLPAPNIIAAGSALTVETSAPTNSAIDPGEIVTVNFSLQNNGTADSTALTAALLATGGVKSPSAAQSYGALTTGGAAVTRAFTFTADSTLICGSTLTATLQLQDGASSLGSVTFTFTLGAPGTVLTQNFDGVTAPALPAGWTTSASGGQSAWVTSTTTPDTAPNAAFSTDAATAGVNELVSPVVVSPAQVSFRHQYDLENTFDGGVLEIKIGAGSFTDIVTAGGTFTAGGYSGALSSSATTNPLGASRAVWTGTSSSYTTSTATLPASTVGQNVQFRWRCGSDSSVGKPGWRVDTVTVDGWTCVACPADLAVNTTASRDPVLTSQNLIYTITATNNGTNPASGVILTETLPASVNLISATGTQGSYTQSGSTLNWTLGNLASGATVTLTVTVKPTATATLTHSAVIAGDQTDPVSANDTRILITSALLDTDGDGIPDAYESAHGMNPNDATDAAKDFDGDGFTNLQEYLIGTDPQSFASAFRLTATRSGNDNTIGITTVTGNTYRVEWTNDLTLWSLLQGNIAGTGGTVTMTDTGAASEPKRFYRASVFIP